MKFVFRARWLIWLACYALAWSPPAWADDRPAATPPLVWVNTRSHIYHLPGCRWYGLTEQGKYVNEAEALAEGDRLDLTEHRQSARFPSSADTRPVVIPRDSPAAVPLSLLPAPVQGTLATPEAPPFSTALPLPSPTVDRATPVPLEPGERLSVCITAIAAQSDPAKLATLGERAANPRLKRIMYYLAQARAGGADPAAVIEQAQQQNGSAGTPRAALVRAGLMRNLKICDGLGLLTPGNLQGLRTGQAPTVTRGPYIGQLAEVDHIVPLSVAPEVGNELANLEMLPATLNRSKSNKVGERQLAMAKKFKEAALISDATLVNVQTRFRPSGTTPYELPEEP